MLKKIAGDSLLTDGLVLPYRLYSDEDIKNRFLYLEASRGCPFKCEFCLSSLDKTAVPFAIDDFIVELDLLYQRGARNFKFVDRTFNLRIDDCERLLKFFLERIEKAEQAELLLHFELIPDHLPERLRGLIAQFPPGCLQFEIGIQTWNPEVQGLISRRQNNEKSEANLVWLRNHSNAHLHVDLIAGLPGESLESFAQGFDRLVHLRPHEIQLGILKRLRGTPISRHTERFNLRFNPNPPYNLLASGLVPFAEMQHLQRFARYWDLIGNSGHFANCLPWLLGLLPDAGKQVAQTNSAYRQFSALSRWIYARTDSTHRFSAERLFELVKAWLEETHPEPTAALKALALDREARLGRSGQPGRAQLALRHSRSIRQPEATVHSPP